MEPWTVERDDRPYLPPARRSYSWAVVVLAIAAIAGLGGYYYYYVQEHQPHPAPAVSAPPQPSAAPAPQPTPAPEVRHPLETAQVEVPKILPSLEASDSLMRDSVSGLVGGKAFAEMVVPDGLVRRIVASVDNLPRPTASRRIMPLNPVPGTFATLRAGEEMKIDPANFLRYVPFVRVVESVNARALVYSYARAYRLFQRAYEELGYPGKYFNDRLIEALDDMLAAPEIDTPIELMRPRVLYEFADPDLETRSAGQKIMIRMGKENALRVKAKLSEFRRELMAVSAHPQ